jgi:hypothetical protein
MNAFVIPFCRGGFSAARQKSPRTPFSKGKKSIFHGKKSTIFTRCKIIITFPKPYFMPPSDPKTASCP